MSVERYEIGFNDDPYSDAVMVLSEFGGYVDYYDHHRIVSELQAEVAMLRHHYDLANHKVITCGVAASHPDAGLASRGAYKEKWDSPQAEEVRKLRAEADSLRKDAERYRFLRSQMKIGSVRTMLPLYKVPYVYLYEECASESGIEDAIDAAMGAKA